MLSWFTIDAPYPKISIAIIEYNPESLLNRDLLKIINKAKTPPRYSIDGIVGSTSVLSICIMIVCVLANITIGHEVVRLPVAHCELNPIEMAWRQQNGHIKQNDIAWFPYRSLLWLKLRNWFIKDLRLLHQRGGNH